MVRRKSDLIRSYFVYDQNSNNSTCQCECTEGNAEDGTEVRKKCARILAGDKASNLESHLKKIHPELYEDYLKAKGTLVAARSSPYSKPVDKSAHTKLAQYLCFSTSSTTTLEANIDEILNGVIELFTVNGRPFTLINDSGFKRAFSPLLDACNLHLSSQNIKQLIHERSNCIINKIQSIVRDKLVCVKLDFATRLDKCFVGINIQLIHEGNIVAFTLSAPQLPVRHINENIKKIVVKEVEKYDIKPENIYSVTTDYCGNVLKAIKSRNRQINNDCNVETVYDDDDLDNVPCPEEGETQHDENDELINKVLDVNWNDMQIASTRCAAHSLQLCVLDTLRNVHDDGITEAYADVIMFAHSLVIELRNKNNAPLLEANNLKKPPLDCASRWESTFEMLRKLVNLKPYVKQFALQNAKLFLPEDVWDKITEIVECLTPCVTANVKLQKESLTLTDIYKIINVCHMSTAEIGLPFANELVFNLNRRRNNLFEHEVFLAAIYLDPRFNFELTMDQREIAIAHIVWIRNRLKALHVQYMDIDVKPPPMDNVKHDLNSMDDPDEERYERLMQEKHKEKLYSASAMSADEFEVLVRTFKPTRLKTSESIIKFWEDSKDVYPELYQIAMVLYAVPGTQVSLDRLVSTLRFILDPLRNSLSLELINDIILIKNNFNYASYFSQNEDVSISNLME